MQGPWELIEILVLQEKMYVEPVNPSFDNFVRLASCVGIPVNITNNSLGLYLVYLPWAICPICRAREEYIARPWILWEVTRAVRIWEGKPHICPQVSARPSHILSDRQVLVSTTAILAFKRDLHTDFTESWRRQLQSIQPQWKLQTASLYMIPYFIFFFSGSWFCFKFLFCRLALDLGRPARHNMGAMLPTGV